eukprot:76949-Pleurochrysis_carterae.AAC.1
MSSTLLDDTGNIERQGQFGTAHCCFVARKKESSPMARLFVRAPPEPDRAISRRRHKEAAVSGDGNPPYLHRMRAHRHHVLEGVGVPEFDELVLAGRHKVVRAADEADCRDRLGVRVEGAVAVAEVEAPDLDRLVRAPRDEQRACAD